MKLHPFMDCVKQATKYMERGALVYQQFNCSGCGKKQTMDVPNTFFEKGICEECKHETDIVADGCNYMLTMGVPAHEPASKD